MGSAGHLVQAPVTEGMLGLVRASAISNICGVRIGACQGAWVASVKFAAAATMSQSRASYFGRCNLDSGLYLLHVLSLKPKRASSRI